MYKNVFMVLKCEINLPSKTSFLLNVWKKRCRNVTLGYFLPHFFRNLSLLSVEALGKMVKEDQCEIFCAVLQLFSKHRSLEGINLHVIKTFYPIEKN
jgi:hypothetical protein